MPYLWRSSTLKKDSMNLALNGDGNIYGFLKIIDKYGSTNAGNLAKFYAGRILIGNGEFEKGLKIS